MARLNVVEAAWDIHGKSGGMCFTTSRIGTSVRINPHMRNWRSVGQKPRIDNMLYCTRAWGGMSSIQKGNWATWVAAHPQPTVNDPLVALRAYENFIKRQFYLNLTTGYPYQPMTAPNGVTYGADAATIVVKAAVDSVTLECTFGANSGNLDTLIFISRSLSAGKQFVDTSWRYMATVRSTNQTVDITDMYFSEFGQLPSVGDNLFLAVVQCGKDNGQFWFPVLAAVVVQPAEPPFAVVNYGMIYNGYAIKSTRGFAPEGWHVWKYTEEYVPIRDYYGGNTVAGFHLKETGTVFWNSTQGSTDNSSLFFGRGNGRRGFDGSYLNFRTEGSHWLNITSSPTANTYAQLTSTAGGLNGPSVTAKAGCGVRLVKNSTTLSNGQTGSMYLNNGKRLKTICIRGFEITQVNSIETKFADGTDIPEVAANAAWAALTTPARCAPNGNNANI